MINILMSMFYPKENWSEKIEGYISKKKVLIIPFSFSEKMISNTSDWLVAYGKLRW